MKDRDSRYFAKIGAEGGKKKVKKGFACMEPGMHKVISAKGGRVSRSKNDREAL